MQRQTDFHPCLDGFEVQPPLAVYPNEILRCELAEVRIAQSGITAEQEGIEHMAHGFLFHLDRFQLLQLVRGKKLMSAFLLFDFVLSERIRICVHISLVDCLIDQGTELSHVLGYRIDRIALFSQVLLKITKECIGKVLEVHPERKSCRTASVECRLSLVDCFLSELSMADLAKVEKLIFTALFFLTASFSSESVAGIPRFQYPNSMPCRYRMYS